MAFKVCGVTDPAKVAGVATPAKVAGVEAGTGGPAYFGNNTDSSSPAVSIDNTANYNGSALTWTCPGSGAQDVNELGAYAACVTAGNIRCAIYTTARAFVMQGNAEIALDGSWAWRTHTTFRDQAGDPIATPQLTGGTSYLLVACADAADCFLGAVTTDANHRGYVGSVDYTAGFPATLPGETGSTGNDPCIRCQVTPA